MAALRSSVPAFITLAVLALAIGIVKGLMPPSDFAPFALRIEAHGSYNGVAELRYTNRSNWRIENPDDAYTYACQDGLYGHFDASGVFSSGRITDAIPCPAPGRWIGYGWAWSVPWPKTESADAITYTNGDERVVFDR